MARKIEKPPSAYQVRTNLAGLKGLYGSDADARTAADTIKQRKKPTQRIEHERHEAVALMNMINYHVARYPQLARIYHVPNGGMRNMVVAIRLKSEGTRPKVPDYCLPVPIMGYHGAYLELKANGNTPDKGQREEMEQLRADGYAVAWADGAENAFDFLQRYLDGDFVLLDQRSDTVLKWER